MEQRKNISLALMIVTFGFLLLGLGLEVYFKQQMIFTTVSAGTAKSLNPKLEGEVLGKIKEWVKDATFTPPAKLPF